MGSFTPELHLQTDTGQGLDACHVHNAGVHDQGGIYVYKGAPLGHDRLAPIKLLGGGADNDYATSRFIDCTF